MNIVLWILQVLLAAAFIAHGVLMIAPPAEVAAQMNTEFPRWFQLFLGIAEVAGGVGIVLPGMTRVMPWLVSWAAGGIVIVMVAATGLHLMRAEWSSAATTLCLLAMAAFVAYKRRR